MEYQVEQTEQNSDTNLTPETRFAYAVYLLVPNSGVMTEHGALLPEGLNMPKLSRQAEISLNLKPGSQIDFDHSGKIIAALILDEVEICTDEGLQKTFLANTMLNFDQNGCVTFAHAVSSDF